MHSYIVQDTASQCFDFKFPNLSLFLIGASLSEPYHVRSTVKSVFLLACLYVCPNPLCGYIVNQTTSSM